MNNEDENSKTNSSRDITTNRRRQIVIDSLISGSLSSASTTIIYQPLELLKTRIQLDGNRTAAKFQFTSFRIVGRATRSASKLMRDHNILYLWRGTGVSLLRSVPGVGLYYATLNVFQTNFSADHHRPDSPVQAFYFGLSARSIVSFLMLPITVVKVRYESGQYTYSSLSKALKDAYLRNGWVGIAPTILRDSLFSGIYYMCYTKLKSHSSLYVDKSSSSTRKEIYRPKHSSNFVCGVISGLIASIITNPIDVLKTNIQVDSTRRRSMKQVALGLLKEEHGYTRLLDGLVPRSLRRTLIAASTWTFYELLLELME